MSKPASYLQSVFNQRRLALAYQNICASSDRAVSLPSEFGDAKNADAHRYLESEAYSGADEIQTLSLHADFIMKFILLTYFRKDYSSKIMARK